MSRAFAVVGRPTGPTVLATADGRPVVVAGEGSTRVVLTTLPLDDRWASLSTFGGPLARSVVRWLAADRSPVHAGDHEVTAGRAGRRVGRRAGGRRVGHGVGGAGDPAGADADRGAGRPDRPAAGPPAGPGSYRVRWRSGGRDQHTFVVVTVPTDGSDLTPMTADGWQSFGRRTGFTLAAAGASPATVSAAVTDGRGGPEAWAACVAAVLVLLTVDVGLSRRWSTAAVSRRPVRGGRGTE